MVNATKSRLNTGLYGGLRILLALCLITATAFSIRADVDDATINLHSYADISSSDLLDRGKNFIMHEMWDSAFVCYSTVAQRSLAGADKDEIACITRAYNNLGYVYLYANNDSKKAYSHFLSALALAENYQINDFLGFIYLNIAYIYYYDRLLESNVPNEMVTYLQKAFDLGYRENNHKLLIHALTSLIEAGIDNHDPSCVTNQLDTFKIVDIPQSTYLYQYILLMSDGMEAYINNNPAYAATRFLEAADSVVTDIGAYQYKIDAMLCAACVYCDIQQFDSSEKVLKRALQEALANRSKQFEASIYSKLAQVYKLMGDNENSHDYDYRYLALKDSLSSNAKIGHAIEAQFELNISNANKQIKELDKQHRQKTFLLIIALIVVIVVLTLLFLVVRSRKRIEESYRLLYQQNVKLLKYTSDSTSQAQKYKQSPLTEDDTWHLYQRIINTLESKQEIFDTDFTIERLSEILQSRKRLVSQAINECGGTNFNTLINKYRITHACRMLNDPNISGKLTIEAIANKVGFKSRTGFSAIFKAATGMTPTVYQRIARQTHNKTT